MSGPDLIVMPKWGLSMEEGRIIEWRKQPGDRVSVGDELAEVETTKIANTVEATASGVLRRITARTGDLVACGGVIGVVAGDDVSDADIDAAIAVRQAASSALADASADFAQARLQSVETARGRRRIRVLDIGSGGTPVVFIHGFGGDLENWMLNQPALGAARRAVAVDLPGHGGSDKAVGAGTAAELAGDLLPLLNQLKVERFHLVAHSFGALVARALRALAVERVLTFTAIAPADLAPVSRDYIDKFLSARRRSDMQAAIANLFCNPGLATRDMAEAMLRYRRLDGVGAALNAIDAANFSEPTPVAEALVMWADLGARGFMIWGEQDAVVPVAGIATPSDDVRRLIMPEAGHMPHLERPDLVNAAIAAHLHEGDAT